MYPYDINQIFAEIELEVVKSLKRNLSRHLKDEVLEGFKWPAWQTMKIRDLQRFRSENADLFKKYVPQVDSYIEHIIRQQYAEGAQTVAQEVIGASLTSSDPMQFFRMNDAKVRYLIDEAKGAIVTTQNAALRFVDDQYRKILLKSQLYASSGAGTLFKAVDMASQDFLSAGINCIEYADGRRVNIASYSEMAIRTSNKKAKLNGEGAMRMQVGEALVLITQYGACSPTCLPWQGKVYVDDVWSNGKPEDYGGKYPRLSAAIEGDLYHPNCRHSHSTFFEGISRIPEPMDEAEVLSNYDAEQKQRYNERMIRKYKRLAEGTLDEENTSKYFIKQKQWERVQRDHLSEFPQLRRNSWRENTSSNGVYNSADYGMIYSPDIQIGRSVGAAAFRDKALDIDGTFKYIKEGSKITKVLSFAGKGTSKPIKVANRLSELYGGDLKDWKKVRGEGLFDIDGIDMTAELHWYEHELIGRKEMKVKTWFK